MPTVPGVPERSVSPGALPNASLRANVSAKDFGEPLAQGLEDVGKAMDIGTSRDKKIADEIAHLEADTSFGAFDNQTAAAFKQRQGKDAAAAYPDTRKAYSTKAEEIEKGLANETQKIAFRASAAARQQSFERFALHHIAAESAAYDEAKTKANVQNSLDAISLIPDDWRTVERHIGDIKRAVDLHGKRNGLPPEAVELNQAKAVSAARASVVQNLLASGKTEDAKTYFHTAGEEIIGDERTNLTKQLEIGVTNDASRVAADTILAKYIDDPNGYAKAMAEAKSITDTAVFDKAVKRIDDTFDMRDKADAKYRTNLNVTAFSAVDKGIDLDSPEMVATMAQLEDLGAAKRVRAYQEQVRKGTRKTDPGTFNAIWSALDSDDETLRDKVLEDPDVIGAIRDKLSESDEQELVKHIAVKRKERQSNARAAESFSAEIENRVTHEAMIGLYPNADDRKTPEYQTREYAFRKALRKAVFGQQGYERKAISEEAVRKQAAALMAPTSWDELPPVTATSPMRMQSVPWLPSFIRLPGEQYEKPITHTGLVFEQPRTGAAAMMVSDIPAAQRRQIEADIRKAGGVPTDEDVVGTFNDVFGGANGGK